MTKVYGKKSRNIDQSKENGIEMITLTQKHRDQAKKIRHNEIRRHIKVTDTMEQILRQK